MFSCKYLFHSDINCIWWYFSFWHILLVVVAGSLVAYKKTQSRILPKQLKSQIEHEKQRVNQLQGVPHSKNNDKRQNTNNINYEEDKETRNTTQPPKLEQNYEYKKDSSVTAEDDATSMIEEENEEIIIIINTNKMANSGNDSTLQPSQDESKFNTDIDIITSGNKNATDMDDTNVSKFKCMKWFFKRLPIAIWQKKRCYLPCVTHTIDQATDIGVIIQFYQIYKYESENNIDCDSINGAYLFWNSIFAFCFYRIISSIWIYNLTGGRIVDTLLQIFDLKLYHALYINFQRNNVDLNSPQRYLMLLEATLESFPQCVIQLYYFIRVGKSGFTIENIIVLVSLITSIINVSSKMISEDKIYFLDNWRYIEFQFSPFHINYRYLVRFCVRAIDFMY